ncbi:hypothetical protein GW17_00048372 [Ensete ventricosum]|nr:hypothetical protein GW17_00048372 [Ensete ventricosum]
MISEPRQQGGGAASPLARSATHGQVVTKAPCKRGAGCGEGQPAREVGVARRGSNPQGRPTPLAATTARRGGAYGHGRLQQARKGRSRPRAHPLAEF